MSDYFGLNHQEVAVLATSFALVGFSAVAAILLMRTRLRATRSDERLRSRSRTCRRRPTDCARCCSSSRRC